MAPNVFVLVEHVRGKLDEITYISLAAGNQVADATGGEVIAIVLGHNSENLVQDLASSKVLYIDHPALTDFLPNEYLEILTKILEEQKPTAFIAGHTSVGMDVVSGLSVRLNLPVISQCQQIVSSNGGLKFISQICGGKIMAEGDLPGNGVLISMVPGAYQADMGKSDTPPPVEAYPLSPFDKAKISIAEYIEPDLSDVDISKEEVLLAVGRGLSNQGDLELVEAVTKQLGGTICASRPVVDQGWLATSRLVGKSGKYVSPKVYLAMGISGAPEHIQGITESNLIIAVNTDPNAPIFDIAQYGVEADLVEFLEEISHQLE